MFVCVRASHLDLRGLFLQSSNSVCLQLGLMTQLLGWELLGFVRVTALLAASVNECWKKILDQ